MDKLDLHTSKPLEASAIDRSVPEFPPADTPEEEAYFNRHHAPDYLEEVQQQVKQFIQFHQKINRRIAVVTVSTSR
jgi:phosphopantothenate-cysteine ligase